MSWAWRVRSTAASASRSSRGTPTMRSRSLALRSLPPTARSSWVAVATTSHPTPARSVVRGRGHQLPPPPPPPPPPDPPPLKPLPPPPPGVAAMVDETWFENELRLLDRSLMENAASELPTYQLEVAAVASMSLNALAHFSTQPNTIA